NLDHSKLSGSAFQLSRTDRMRCMVSDVCAAWHRQPQRLDSLAMERYRRLVDASPDGILIVDGDRIAFANQAAVALFGVDDAAQVLGRSIVDCLDADSRDGLNDRLQRARMGE